jgi:hypothetical protein
MTKPTNPSPKEADKKKPEELDENQLERVSGGGGTPPPPPFLKQKIIDT